jgi:hypothetical protein
VHEYRRNPLVPRETRRWRELYKGRGAVERTFGRLKHEYGLAPRSSPFPNALFFGLAGFASIGAIAELFLASRVQRFANRNANLS